MGREREGERRWEGMMGLLRWHPFEELRRLTEDFERAMNRWWSRPVWSVVSPMDGSVVASDDGYRVRIPLPGIAPEHIELDVADRTVHIRATERDGDTDVVRYEQVLTLPTSVDADKISATYRHGLLELAVPYLEAVKPRRIEITTEQPKQLPKAA
jgi:HSP20 family protein